MNSLNLSRKSVHDGTTDERTFEQNRTFDTTTMVEAVVMHMAGFKLVSMEKNPLNKNPSRDERIFCLQVPDQVEDAKAYVLAMRNGEITVNPFAYSSSVRDFKDMMNRDSR